MKDLIDNIHKWLKRNRTGGSSEPERKFHKKGETLVYAKGQPKTVCYKRTQKTNLFVL